LREKAQHSHDGGIGLTPIVERVCKTVLSEMYQTH
jgi:hypothetical protein